LRKCSYVGNIHPQVTEPLLQELFSSAGALEGCKLIRKEKVSFVDSYLIKRKTEKK
jgi:RNA recognition motif-containing protein